MPTSNQQPFRRFVRNGIRALLALANCLILATAAYADINEIEEIIVAGELEETIPLDLSNYGNQVSMVLSEEIEAMGFADVSQALQMLAPGLYLAPKNGPFDYVNASLQGSRRHDILWLVDGVRITNRLYNGTTPLDTIPAHSVERIEILKGGQGIFYGSQSVGGVVNIVTTPYSPKLSGEIGLGVNSNDGYNLNASLRGGSKQHKYVVSVSRDEARGYQPYRDEDLQPSSTDRERGYEVNSLGIKYAWSPWSNSTLSLQGIYTVADLDYSRPFLNNRTVNAREEAILTAKLAHRLNDAVEVYIKAYQHTWDTEYTRIYNELDEDGSLTGGIVVRNNESYWGYDDYGFTAMAQLNLSDPLEFIVGLDQQHFSGEDEVWRIADQREKVTAPFIQIRTTKELLESTTLALGLRHNRASNMTDSTVWNVTGKHFFNDSLYIQGNIGTSFRLPDAEALFLDEYYDDNHDEIPDGGWFAIGNPALKPEKSKNLNVSIGGNHAALTFELTYFARNVTNYIDSYVPVTIGGVVGETFLNSDDEVNIDGLELQLQHHFSESSYINLNYIGTKALFMGDGSQLAGIPEAEVKIGLHMQPASNSFGIHLAIDYVSDINDRRTLDSYVIADLAGTYSFGARDQHLLSLRLENAFDEEYSTSIGVGTIDSTGESYLYDNLGMKRTLHLNYRYQF